MSQDSAGSAETIATVRAIEPRFNGHRKGASGRQAGYGPDRYTVAKHLINGAARSTREVESAGDMQ